MSDYFPVEIILEILKRLPVKSLVKFRLVCKTWNSLICNPSFSSTHLQTALSKLDTHLFLLRRIKNVLKRDWGDSDQFDIWIMKEYGVVGSWTKALHLTDQSGSLPRVLGFRKNGEILLEVEDGEMASLDLNCQQMEHLGIEAEVGFSFVESYVESLVLLNKGVDVSSANDANHAKDSSDSDASSEAESEMT